ncbi:MAG: phytoene/squalene synthase family protein [Flavobacteriales bacterium]|nr:phytoene/squalene synthase family protein [Flavobacteriales bacterium]
MDALKLYDNVAAECAKRTTKAYSTSFSLGIRFLAPSLREAIYNIYGFVRYADEIVDTLHGPQQSAMFARFKEDTYWALEHGMSSNPILHAFAKTYQTYNIEQEHVDLFLRSMEWDLDKTAYDRESYDDYIVGSAEVVGLMCLHVFVFGDRATYERLLPNARSLGAAFQKVNFLRDLKDDFEDKGRIYFPGVDMSAFNAGAKTQIEAEIAADFRHAYQGIVKLPKESRLGVYVAYVYYQRLFQKIAALPSNRIMEERVRIPNRRKATLFVGSYLRHSFNLL